MDRFWSICWPTSGLHLLSPYDNLWWQWSHQRQKWSFVWFKWQISWRKAPGNFDDCHWVYKGFFRKKIARLQLAKDIFWTWKWCLTLTSNHIIRIQTVAGKFRTTVHSQNISSRPIFSYLSLFGPIISQGRISFMVDYLFHGKFCLLTKYNQAAWKWCLTLTPNHIIRIQTVAGKFRTTVHSQNIVDLSFPT